jgi:hypothetical protein
LNDAAHFVIDAMGDERIQPPWRSAYLANLEMVAGCTWKVLAMAWQLSPAARRLRASAC